MAQLSVQARSRASVAKQLANFTNSTAGLDLTLRLFHSLVLIGAELDFDKDTVLRCSIAASQIGLGQFSGLFSGISVLRLLAGRRYLRFFCFLDCFQNVQDILAAGYPVRNRTAMMDLVESSCLGMYLLVEGTTMVRTPSFRLSGR